MNTTLKNGGLLKCFNNHPFLTLCSSVGN